MKNTGERHDISIPITDEAEYYIHLMHLATYNYSLQFVKNKNVLDYGCGMGYGSQMLAKEAANVIAVDIDEEAVEYAIKTYPADNLNYQKLDEFDSITMDKFDVITSFQVIEHVKKEKDYVVKLRKRLKPGGYLLISTPDRSNRLFPYIQRPWNVFHRKEYSDHSLHKLLKKYFNEVKILKTTSNLDLVKSEIQRRKKQRFITLPCTLFFYPDFIRIRLLKSEASLFKQLKGFIKGNNSKFSVKVMQNENPMAKYTISDIQISENVQNSTDLIAICKLDAF